MNQHQMNSHSRRGSVVVLSLVMMVVMFAAMAFALDLGYVFANRTQMQRCADAAAMAAAWDLYDQQIAQIGQTSFQQSAEEAGQVAAQYAAWNNVANLTPQLADDDVTIGYLVNPRDPSIALDSTPFGSFNAARVRVQRTSEQNGAIPLFFARFLGHDMMNQSVEATAAYSSSFRGFTTPSNGQNLGILPIALDIDTWDALLHNGVGTDDWTWDANNGEVSAGADGILEVNLYPQGIGLPGNRGTVDIGSSGNSTEDLKRQILDGISASDLAHHGGSLEFDENGELSLNGDTGLSAGIKDQLEQVKGRPNIIPLFTEVQGNGNNANYTIVRFVGVRIMEVKLTGKMNSKRVIVQPAPMKTLGGIYSQEPTTSSEFIFSPVVLAR